VSCAELVLVSKDLSDPVSLALASPDVTAWISAENDSLIHSFLIGLKVDPQPHLETDIPHPGYFRWSCAAPLPMSRGDLKAKLAAHPKGRRLYLALRRSIDMAAP